MDINSSLKNVVDIMKRKNEDIIDFMRRGFEWEEHDLWRTF